MTNENKQRVREEIAKDSSWVVIDGILGEDISVLAWDKEVEIIYQNMDSRPCMCKAECVKPSFNDAYFVAKDGMAKGNKMSAVIAYRILKEGGD